jgi:hypothetical protein
MKYIIQVYEGEINGHGEKEGLPTELNRQKLVERFGSGGCFRLFHSLSQKDQEFGHQFPNKECGCGEKVAWTVICDCYQCLSWDF